MSENPITAKALYNSVTPAEAPITAKALYNAFPPSEVPIKAKVLCNAITRKIPEFVMGLTYDAWIFKSTEMAWYKDGIINPPDIPSHELGIQWGFHVWSIRRKKWVRG